MRSGSVIFTTRYPKHLAVFVLLVVLALVLLVFGCCDTVAADWMLCRYYAICQSSLWC